MTDPRFSVLAASFNPPRPAEQVTPVFKTIVDEPWTERDGYAVVGARSGGMCECNGLDDTGTPKPGCGKRAEVHHHIAGRRITDPHRPSNLLHLTDACHRRVHANPRQSYKDGTMRSRLAVES